MTEPPADPYSGNILVHPLGAILSRAEVLQRLTELPRVPKRVAELPKHVRLHYLVKLRDLHIPSLEGARVHESVDLLLRQGYGYRDPRNAGTWGRISDNAVWSKAPRAPAMAAAIVGHSGTGKTQSILRALGCYPRQVIVHEKYPGLVGAHAQLVWLSVDVPSSGRSEDLAANLMTAWDETMVRYFPDQPRRFEEALRKERRDGQKMLDEWRRVALVHCLGLLHLDEIGNLFKLLAMRQRKTRRRDGDHAQLSIVEDTCLRWIVSLLNTWGLPVVFSGTPDGFAALTRRLSTVQRITVGGYHHLAPFDDPDGDHFAKVFFPQLMRYQFVRATLKDSLALRQMLLELTAGIPRLIIAFWFAAHRRAFERSDDSLRMEDFEHASKTLLAPVMPAVAALRSGDPAKLAQFEDLMSGRETFWDKFWAV